MLAPLAIELLADCLFMLLIGWGWETLRGTFHNVRLTGPRRESHGNRAWYDRADCSSPRIVGCGAARKS
jgi:hypothetical protein